MKKGGIYDNLQKRIDGRKVIPWAAVLIYGGLILCIASTVVYVLRKIIGG